MKTCTTLHEKAATAEPGREIWDTKPVRRSRTQRFQGYKKVFGNQSSKPTATPYTG